jgi:hypothetical protein
VSTPCQRKWAIFDIIPHSVATTCPPPAPGYRGRLSLCTQTVMMVSCGLCIALPRLALVTPYGGGFGLSLEGVSSVARR